MKVILTGATGFIGGEVLLQLLDNSNITSIIALSRRPVATTHPKLRTIIMDHWVDYPGEVIREMDGAEACIWALGMSQPPDVETMRRVTIEYTLAATSTISTYLAPRLADGKRFRFIYLSGMLTEQNASKNLRYAQEFRRGEVEDELIGSAGDPANPLEIYLAAPGPVTRKESRLSAPSTPTVRVDELAAALIRVALRGDPNSILENSRLKEQGRAILRG